MNIDAKITLGTTGQEAAKDIFSMKIPANVFESFTKWMVRNAWPDILQIVLHEHFNEFCDSRDIDSFEEMTAVIGSQAVTTLRDIAFNDFLSRENEEGNVVDDYLKRHGWKEKTFAKAYLEAIRNSVVSLYEVVSVHAGETVIVKDLMLGGEAITVEEQTASKTLEPGDHIAAWIVNVRSHIMISGGILPFETDLSTTLLEELQRMADDLDRSVKEQLDDEDDRPDDETMDREARALTLKNAAPLFSTIWLKGIDKAETTSVH